MSTAAGLVSSSPLQVALQIPADTSAPANPGDFAATLAAACMAEPEAGLPEGMQSAAALAWLAGFVGSVQPATSQPEPVAINDSGDAPLLDAGLDTEVVPDAALSILQEMLAPFVSNIPHEAPVESDAASQAVVVDVNAVAAFAAVPAIAVNNTSVASAADPDAAPADTDVAPDVAVMDANDLSIATPRAAPVVVPLALMKAMNADAQPESGLSVAADATAIAGIAPEKPATNEAPRESSMGERMISALVDRASMRSESAAASSEPDRSAVAGPNLYASTREAVANTSGQVSSRPEVVHATVGSPRWANELGSRLAMMSVRGQQEGSLTLTPEHLGPLEVRITVNQNTTNVWFGAQHADTRAALADAMPQLREMFAASGLSLGQSGVSHQMPGREPPRSESSGSRLAAGFEAPEALPAVTTRISSGLLDTWA